MSLLTLMFHRARAGPFGNAPATLDAHFALIAERYACVLPGEPLDRKRLNVCLTFDDAYFDFYAVVFPLLKKHGLRALLAVPPVVVREEAAGPADDRLQAETSVDVAHQHYRAFCTWTELQEMAASGSVTIAAHGFTHTRLDAADVDLHTEIVVPQTVLAARLGQHIDSFVFPYGRFSPAALHRVRQHYRYAFRIGGARNRNWDGMLYRVDADRMTSPGAPFSPASLLSSRARFFWNRLRGR